MSLFAAGLLFACGSDTKTNPDGGGKDTTTPQEASVDPDFTVDSGVDPDLPRLPDSTVDGPVNVGDSTVDGPVVIPDGPVVTPDGPGTDGPVVFPDGPVVPPPANSVCSAPERVTLDPSGTTTVSATNAGALDEYAGVTCGLSDPLPGGQLYYKVTLTAGKAYAISLAPDYDPALYAFPASTTCAEADVEAACTGHASDELFAGTPESLTIMATTTEDWIIVVDAWDASEVGSFDLTIVEGTVPTNTTCAAPETITLASGTGTVTGDTSFSADEFAGVHCSYPSQFAPWPGPQVYYKVNLTAGKSYRAVMTAKTPADWDGALYAFPASTTCDEAAINAACEGYSADLTMPNEAVVITPATTGDWIIVVDSYAPSVFGSFELKVTEGTPAANATCANAQAITLSGGSATVTGTTADFAQNEFGAQILCGGQITYSGPQLYYKIDMTAGHAYKLGVTAKALVFLTTFTAADCDPAKIETQCASVGATGDTMWAGDDVPLELIVRPAADTTYYFALDTLAASLGDDFTVEVTDLGAIPTFVAPFAFNFDGDCKGLAATNDWECGALAFSAGTGCDAAATPPTAAKSGTGVWGTKLNDCYSALNNTDGFGSTCSNVMPNDDSVLTFKVTIPAGWTTSASLKYWSWEDIYGEDWAEVRVAGAAVATSAICESTYTAPTAWVERTIDLAAHVGTTVEVSFHMMSSGADNVAGWYIDDLSVSGS